MTKRNWKHLLLVTPAAILTLGSVSCASTPKADDKPAGDHPAKKADHPATQPKEGEAAEPKAAEGEEGEHPKKADHPEKSDGE